MNVFFKCFQCNTETTKDDHLDIHSYSWNKEKEFFVIDKNKDKEKNKDKDKLFCQHFSNIKLKWKTRYGFFTLGWKIEIYDVSAKCRKCNKILCFQNQIFNSNNNWWEEVKDCCDNVIVYSVREGKPGCSDTGKELQEKINKLRKLLQNLEKKLQDLKEEREKLEKEEKERKQKEEEEMRQKEEEERKEKEEEERKEKNRRSQYDRENREMLEIMKQQEKEAKELNEQVNAGTSFIEEQMSQMNKEADIIYYKNITFDPQKEINATYKIQKKSS